MGCKKWLQNGKEEKTKQQSYKNLNKEGRKLRRGSIRKPKGIGSLKFSVYLREDKNPQRGGTRGQQHGVDNGRKTSQYQECGRRRRVLWGAICAGEGLLKRREEEV